jgi:hypothetical protein
MPYTPTDTARAAEKVERDIEVLSENEAAAWDRFAAAALNAMMNDRNCDNMQPVEVAGSTACYAVAMIRERRRRLVAGRVESRLTPAEQAVIDAAVGWRNAGAASCHPRANGVLVEAIDALAAERSRT